MNELSKKLDQVELLRLENKNLQVQNCILQDLKEMIMNLIIIL